MDYENSYGNENDSIECTVSECRYHLDSDFCSLESIKVVVNDGVDNVVSTEGTGCG